MSVFRPKKKDGTQAEFYIYDFWLRVPGRSRSQRFTGPTGAKTRVAAKRIEDRVREKAASGQLNDLMTVEAGTKRYLEEIIPQSEHARRQQVHCMDELLTYYGAETPLVDITPDDVARARSKRARTPIMRLKRLPSAARKNGGQRAANDDEKAWQSTGQLPAPATVNRQVIEPLRRLLRRARKHWGVPVDLEQFQWGGRDGVKFEEPEGRTRELTSTEEAVFWQTIDEGYEDLCELFIVSGKRQSIWVGLLKEQVDLVRGTVKMRVLKQRRVKVIDAKLAPRELEIVASAYRSSPANCPFVFTARSYRKRDGGLRRPITASMFRNHVKKACGAAGIKDFRPHDFRHTFGSRALRADPNLRKLQEAMDHSSIKSTVRYAHVLDEDVVKMRSAVTVSRPGKRKEPGPKIAASA